MELDLCEVVLTAVPSLRHDGQKTDIVNVARECLCYITAVQTADWVQPLGIVKLCCISKKCNKCVQTYLTVDVVA